MIYSVHQPQYLPWLGFFDKIDKSDCFVFLDNVQYKHREYQNRNKIRTKDGWMWLTVPVRYERGQRIRDIRIDNARDWTSHHLKSLRAWYARAEFFKKYFPVFQRVYSKRWNRLIDLNVFLIDFFLKSLGISKKIYFESKLSIRDEKTDRSVAIGKKLKAKNYLSGVGAKNYLQESKFESAGIKLVYQNFIHPVYRQLYGKGGDDFIPFLSIIDLLFNEGDRSLGILRGQIKELKSIPFLQAKGEQKPG